MIKTRANISFKQQYINLENAKNEKKGKPGIPVHW